MVKIDTNQSGTNAMNVVFSVGALSRSALEDLAADFGIQYSKHTSSDELRSDLLEQFAEQGEPCIKVEYDDVYTGGDYSGVGSFAYVPVSLVNAFEGDVDLAFGGHLHKDAMHIIHYESEQKFAANGEPFIGLEIVEN